MRGGKKGQIDTENVWPGAFVARKMQGKKTQFAPFMFVKREMSRIREGKKESFVTVVNNFASAEKKRREKRRFSLF